MRRILIFAPLGAAVVLAFLAGPWLGSNAQEASPPPNSTPDPVMATAAALGVPTDCVANALGTPVGPGAALPATASPSAVLPTTATIALFDLGYRPCALTVPADVPVTLTLTNDGTAVGNFVIDALGVRSEIITQGQTASVVINASPGVYTFYSEPPGQREAGRAGILTVVGAGTPVVGGSEASTPVP